MRIALSMQLKQVSQAYWIMPLGLLSPQRVTVISSVLPLAFLLFLFVILYQFCVKVGFI